MTTEIDRFRELLRIPTVSHDDESRIEWDRFDEFADAIRRLYPRVHASLDLETVAGHSLLYRWRGRDTGDATILMAHQDVVPVVADEWQHAPFAADVVGEGPDAEIHARGAIDDKGALVAILEAVERLLASGFAPERDVYLAFGHNEETAGDGARTIAETLRDRRVRAALVLDEGGAVVEGVFLGVDVPTAMIGVAERGVMTLRLTASETGGHASTPPADPATARLGTAIARLRRSPFRARLTPPIRAMLATVSRHAPQPLAAVLRGSGLLGSVVAAVLTRLGPEMNASVRTTAVVTMLEGASASNVLATRARAWVNIRLLPGDTVASATAHVRRAIGDPEIEIQLEHGNDPSAVSPWHGEAWASLARAVRSTLADDRYPEGPQPTPYLQLGASDSRWFSIVSTNVYRFTPFHLSRSEREALHAHDERIRVGSWLRGIDFYAELLRSR